jgi:hypothetical protein
MATPTANPPQPVRIFCSYSHEDEKLREQFDDHLSALRRSNLVETWDDRMIRPGSNWKAEIEAKLGAADVILLLVSPSFLNSDFCYSVEMKRALERHENKQALVIPVMIRPCDIEGTPIAFLQQVPKDGKPVTRWKKLDDGFEDAAKRVRIAVQAWPKARRQASATASPEERASATKMLAKAFGSDNLVSAGWFHAALDRAATVARIEKIDGRPIGTGFLVDPLEFAPAYADETLLLTCSYIVHGDQPYPYKSIAAEQAAAFFEIVGIRRRVKKVLWSSPSEPNQLGTTLATLDSPIPGVRPAPLRSAPERPHKARWTEDRIAIIGYPGDRGLSFSITETTVRGTDGVRIQYGGATEPGSGGSPVFDWKDWRVRAIHFSRPTKELVWSNNPHDLREGIVIGAIRAATTLALRSA